MPRSGEGRNTSEAHIRLRGNTALSIQLGVCQHRTGKTNQGVEPSHLEARGIANTSGRLFGPWFPGTSLQTQIILTPQYLELRGFAHFVTNPPLSFLCNTFLPNTGCTTMTVNLLVQQCSLWLARCLFLSHLSLAVTYHISQRVKPPCLLLHQSQLTWCMQFWGQHSQWVEVPDFITIGLHEDHEQDWHLSKTCLSRHFP